MASVSLLVSTFWVKQILNDEIIPSKCWMFSREKNWQSKFWVHVEKVGKTNLLCHRSKVRVNTVTWKLTERIAAMSSLSWEIPPQRLHASICPKLYILLQYLQHPQHCFTVCMAYFPPQERKIRLRRIQWGGFRFQFWLSDAKTVMFSCVVHVWFIAAVEVREAGVESRDPSAGQQVHICLSSPPSLAKLY